MELATIASKVLANKRAHGKRVSGWLDASGVQHVWRFGNGRGASVVRHDGSYGHEDGLWELAVLDRAGSLDYSTPVTSDVEGWLTPAEVRRYLRQIEALP